MAQLIVRNLEDSVRDELRARAADHGRSMEEEVREIIRTAVLSPSNKAKARKLGSRLARRFRRTGLKLPIAELRGSEAVAADFG